MWLALKSSFCVFRWELLWFVRKKSNIFKWNDKTSILQHKQFCRPFANLVFFCTILRLGNWSFLIVRNKFNFTTNWKHAATEWFFYALHEYLSREIGYIDWMQLGGEGMRKHINHIKISTKLYVSIGTFHPLRLHQ